MCSKIRDYAITWNNYTEENYQTLKAFKCRYIVIGREICPTTGTPHLQAYFYMSSARSWASIQHELHGACIKDRYSTPEAAANYCKKTDPDYYERGDIPKQGKRTDVEMVRDELRSGTGMRGVVRVATNLQCIKIAEAILKYEEPKRDWVPEILWYWGPTNSGKSKQAHKDFKDVDFYRKTSNTEKWWDGYDGHENVIFDDFVFPDKILDYKNWLDLFDRYSCSVQTKGGMRQLRAKKMIVTSAQNPYEMLKHFDQGGAEFFRRITAVFEFSVGLPPILTLRAENT